MTNTSKPSAITIKKTIGKVKSVKVKKLKFTKKERVTENILEKGK